MLFLHSWHIFKSRFTAWRPRVYSTFTFINNQPCAKLQSCRVETLNYKSRASASRFTPDIYGSCLFIVGLLRSAHRQPNPSNRAHFSTFRRSFTLSFILVPQRMENNFQRQIAHHGTQAAIVWLLWNLLESFRTICSSASLQ